jgi:hypothetical protein
LAGLARSAGSLEISSSEPLGRSRHLHLKLVTENAAVARKAFSLVKGLFHTISEVSVERLQRLRRANRYVVRVVFPGESAQVVLHRLGLLDRRGAVTPTSPAGLLGRACCRRSYLRGLFMGSGFVSDPERPYHLELILSRRELAEQAVEVLGSFGIRARVAARKESFLVYLKDGEQIGQFISVIGAHQALLNYENIRITKGMRNRVNRLVNMETANLAKVADAAVNQTEAIEKIIRTIGLGALSPGLQEAARLRLDHPEATLQELGDLARPHISKSGVNHRLRRLVRLAADLSEN